MGNERYTSPALSRDLAAAGMEQKGDFMHGVFVYCLGEGEIHEQSDECELPIHRALRLDDVLHEIETRGSTWLIETDHGTYCATAVLNPKFSAVMGGPSAVEAAGLCLLALLDKERETKP